MEINGTNTQIAALSHLVGLNEAGVIALDDDLLSAVRVAEAIAVAERATSDDLGAAQRVDPLRAGMDALLTTTRDSGVVPVAPEAAVVEHRAQLEALDVRYRMLQMVAREASGRVWSRLESFATTIGTRPRSMRIIIAWPNALAACASAADRHSRN